VSSRIGFIGLGVMGRPMARNLLNAGNKLAVYDISPAGVAELAAAGAAAGSSAKDVAERSDVIITMLPDGPDVEKAVLGRMACSKARGRFRAGGHDSINPIVSQKVGKACAEKGVEFLDAPVSGASPRPSTPAWRSWWAGPRGFHQAVADPAHDGRSVTLTGPVALGI